MARVKKEPKRRQRILVTLFDEESDLLKRYQDKVIIREAATAVRKLIIERLRELEKQEAA